MTYEIERKILNNMVLNNNEVYEFLSYVCNLIRKDSNIVDPFDSNCMVCDETSEKFGRLMLMRFGCDVEKLDISKLLQIPLTHYANIISFNVNGNKKTYLVDMTYSQFFGKKITLDDGSVVSAEKTFGKIKNEQFVNMLRKDGFIELNGLILKKYIDSFIDICIVKSKSTAYKNLNKLFEEKNIQLIKNK